MSLTIRFFPARYGDSILIGYGDAGNLKYILIDGGTGGTRSEILSFLNGLPDGHNRLEIMAVTHIDKDHIEGVQRILEADALGFEVGDFWFNGYHHLSPERPGEEAYGSRQGELMTGDLLRHNLKWNDIVGGAALFVPEEGPLPAFELRGGLKITLLSPSLQHLFDLKPLWEAELLKLKLESRFGSEKAEPKRGDEQAYGAINVDALNAMKFEEDRAEANASSLAFLLEFEGRKILLLGDAQPGQIYQSLKRLQPEGRFAVDLCKISHHASRGNTSPELLELLDCNHFVISTNGSIYGHPHQETIARIIKRSSADVKLYFNYRTKHNSIWEDADLCFMHGYSTTYGKKGMLEISL